VQRADKLGGLWGIASIHTGGVAQLALSQTAKWLEPFTIHLTKRKHQVTVRRRVADPRQRRAESFPCHERVTSRARRPRILANVLGLKALVVPLKLNSSERRRMLVSGRKIRPVSVRVRLGAHETAAQRPSAPDGTDLSPAAVRSASAVDSVTASKASAIRPRSSGNRCP
jgi:hypothetical protein